MYRFPSFSAGIALLLAATIPAGASAQVYKWVDEQGNIHFGDKPLDRDLAGKAEQVEIIESYQPSARTAEEQAVHEQQQEAIMRRREVYQQEDLEGRELAQQQAREEKEERCAYLDEKIEELSSMDVANGTRTYSYVTDEDGKSVSSDRQREIVEELRQAHAAAGCD